MKKVLWFRRDLGVTDNAILVHVLFLIGITLKKAHNENV
ncbi:MAG: Unknown protein [uncultured Sulfurovum sp.]|uniref:Uncharacterized protein n=1 Tax=uncultured Sulfurovum sp. TaxID=269237 RepID=A0A6S6SW93_9BACT|nr:MAG: Unknown protein [uncultured Sulfurovum sp.]